MMFRVCTEYRAANFSNELAHGLDISLGELLQVIDVKN